MNKVGVTCYSIYGISNIPDGENHGWNCIEIDNQFYMVDVCWDEQGATYRDFMCSAADFQQENNGHSKLSWTACSDTNYWKKVSMPSTTISLNNLGDVTNDGKVTKEDYTNLQNHYSKGISYNLDTFRRADINCDGQIDKTDLTMLNDYLSQSLSLGDVVKDGIVDIYDKGYVQRYLNNSIKNPLTSEELKRADMNLDGKVDNTDLELITAAIQNNVTYHSVTTVKDYSINYVKTH